MRWGTLTCLSGIPIPCLSNTGTAVCEIDAPPEVVWKSVLAFDRYGGDLSGCAVPALKVMLGNSDVGLCYVVASSSRNVRSRRAGKHAEVYARSKLLDGEEKIKVHLTLDGFVRNFEVYYDHLYRPNRDELTSMPASESREYASFSYTNGDQHGHYSGSRHLIARTQGGRSTRRRSPTSLISTGSDTLRPETPSAFEPHTAIDPARRKRSTHASQVDRGEAPRQDGRLACVVLDRRAASLARSPALR